MPKIVGPETQIFHPERKSITKGEVVIKEGDSEHDDKYEEKIFSNSLDNVTQVGEQETSSSNDTIFSEDLINLEQDPDTNTPNLEVNEPNLNDFPSHQKFSSIPIPMDGDCLFHSILHP